MMEGCLARAARVYVRGCRPGLLVDGSYVYTLFMW